MDRAFIVSGDSDLHEDFTSVAETEGMSVFKERLVLLSADAPPGIDVLFVALKEGGPVVTAAVSAAYVMAKTLAEWLKGRATREVTIVRNLKDRTTTVEAKGYSVKELAAILEDAGDIWIKEAKPPKPTKSQKKE